MHLLTEPTTAASGLAIVVAAGLLHASFQLSSSVMTLLSGHALGRKKAHSRLLRLTASYIAGNAIMINLLLLAAAYVITGFDLPVSGLWAAVCGVGVGTAIGVFLLYYRANNTSWLPSTAQDYLFERTKKTKRSFEAFGLGMLTTLAEAPFLLAGLAFTAMILRGEPTVERMLMASTYVLLAILPLLILFVAIGSGTKISRLERWRDENQRFLQVASGSGLLVISLYAFFLFVYGS